MASIVEVPPIGFLVDLVNGWANAVRHDPAPKAARTFPNRARFEELYDLHLSSATSDSELIVIGDAFYRIFATDPEKRLETANIVLGETPVRPVLAVGGLQWASEGTPTEGLAAAALLGHAVADPTLSRLDTCTGNRCRDAYVDSSQARTRRFCGERCQTRTKAQRRRN